jgi:hypothetical protein
MYKMAFSQNNEEKKERLKIRLEMKGCNPSFVL